MDLANNTYKQVFAELGCRQLAHWAVDVTYVQIYNEAFQDLLCPGTPAADISVVDQKRAPRSCKVLGGSNKTTNDGVRLQMRERLC